MLYLEKAKVYGVDNVGQSSPTLLRTDDALGLTYTVGESEIKSDFDRCYPWSDMHEVTDDYGNVFIRIPKFYAKRTKNANGTYKVQISGVRYSGFTTLFVDGRGNEIDYIDVGKYEGSGSKDRVYSKSGQNVLVNITQDNFRLGCKAYGAGYQMYDFLIDLIIKDLFMIEFATTNSQSIMYGYCNGNTAAIATGRCDGVKTPSGSEISNTDGKHAMVYRGIENLWGNTWTFVDGVSFDVEKMYVCKDPEYYSTGKTDTPYIYVADRPTTSGWTKTITPMDKDPLLMYTTEVGGGNGTYYCDQTHYAETGVRLDVGGDWYNGTVAGLWLWSGNDAASYLYSNLGGRLCRKPLNGGTGEFSPAA